MRRIARWLLFLLVMMGVGTQLNGQSVNLGWTASSDPTTTGYIICWGTVSGKYTESKDVGTNTSVTVSNLTPGATYFFAATSFNATGLQGAYSTEIAHTVPAATAFTFANLTQIYNGAPESAAVTTGPANVPVTLTYNGSTNAPVNAGAYTVVATAQSPGSGSATNTFIIIRAAASVSVSGLSAVYSGHPHNITVTTSPAGLAATTSYNGIGTAPVNAGSYAVLSTVNNSNYTGSASGTLVVAQAIATLALGNLAQTFTGSALPATATTTPSGLAVNITYNGIAAAPTNSGTYTVVSTVNNSNYSGSATGALVISPRILGASTTTLASSQNPGQAGSVLTFSAVVRGSGGTPTSTVAFWDGSASLGAGTLNSSGVATLSIAALSASGSPHAITAVYGGDSFFAGSSSSVLTQFITNSGATDITNGLVAWYPLAGDVNDHSGHGNNATLFGSPSYTTGVNGAANTALAFNGSAQYDRVLAPANLPDISGDLTLSCWVEYSSASARSIIFSLAKDNTKSVKNSVDIELLGANLIGAVFAGGGAIVSTTAPSANQWHFLTYVQAAGVPKFYIDGVYAKTGTASGQSGPVGEIGLGYFSDGWPTPYFSGNGAEFRIYNRALSATEIGVLYANGVAAAPAKIIASLRRAQAIIPTLLPVLDSPAIAAPQQFRFRVTGVSGQSYTAQYSTDLTNWTDLYTTNAPDIVFFVADPRAAGVRFYRLRVNK